MTGIAKTPPSDQQALQELIRRCLEGDEQAWRTFYARFAPLIPSWIHDFRLPPDCAHELAHDFIGDLWRLRKLSRYRAMEGVRFETWLRFLLRRYVLRSLSRKRVPLLSNTDPSELLGSRMDGRTGDPHALLCIYMALDRLEGRDRRLAGLVLEGFPYAEIGRRLETTEAAVTMAVKRLRERLGGLLNHEGLGFRPPGDLHRRRREGPNGDTDALP